MRDRRLPLLRPAGPGAALLGPASELTEELFEDGFGFDGSSIRGFQEIQESDMLLMPDPDTAYMDPFTQHRTLNINCFVNDPVTGEMYSRDPRYVAKKAELYLKRPASRDIATGARRRSSTSSTRSGSTRTSTRASTTSIPTRASWNSGARGGRQNLGYEPRYKEGYFPLPPTDQFQDLRSEMVLNLREGRASRSRCTTTRSVRPGRPRSTCASARC